MLRRRLLLLLTLHLLPDGFGELVGNAQELDRIAANVRLGNLPEALAVLGRANAVLEMNVHPVIDLVQTAVVRFARLHFD